MEQEFVEKYWICGSCADGQGAKMPEGACNTAIQGKCGHCKSGKVELLIPVVDFNWPDGRKAWFD